MGQHRARGADGRADRSSPAFRRLLAALSVSLVGDGVRLVALPLTAAILTGSPLALAAVAAAELLPWLLLSMPVGAWVDRSRPRAALVGAHLGRAGLSAVLVAVLVTGHAGVAVLCALAFALTTLETAAGAASQVLVVQTVGMDGLLAANTRVMTAESVLLNLAGPLVGGALVALGAELGLAFVLDGVTFLVAAGLVLTVPAPDRPGPDGTDPDAGTRSVGAMRRAVAEGLGVLWRTPGLRLLMGVTIWTSLATGAVNAVTTLYALEVLQLSVGLVPLIVVVEALGVLLGAQLVRRVADRVGEGTVLAAAVLLVGGAYLVVGLVPSLVVVLASYLVGGLGFGWWNVLSSTRRQRLTPPEVLGCTSNAGRSLTFGAMPLGAVLGGLLASAVSLSAVYLAGGGLVLVVGLLARRALVASGAGAPPRLVAAPV